LKALFLNDGSESSRIRAESYKNKGYELYSVYGHFSTLEEIDKMSSAENIANLYCFSHDVCTIEAWNELENALYDSAYKWGIFINACTPVILRNYPMPDTTNKDIEVIFGFDVPVLDRDSLMGHMTVLAPYVRWNWGDLIG
jgi:hypothetical protein